MEDVYCPICVEAMDFTDLATALCSCNFKVCLWCYKRICEDDGAQARCPNCRTVYDQERIRQQQLDPKQCATFMFCQQSLTLAPVLIPFAMPQCRPIVCRNLRTSLPELCAGGYLGTPSIFAWLDSASVRSAGAALILLRLASVCKAQCFCRQTVVLVTTDVLARALRRSLIPIVSHRYYRRARLQPKFDAAGCKRSTS